MRVLIVLFLMQLAVAPGVQAEIYRWTDEQGVVHFGDKRPQDGAAEDVTESAEKVNVDNSRREYELMNRLMPLPSEQDKAAKPQPNPALLARCEKAKKDLDILRKKRFYFVDENGETSTISSKERDRLADELEANIKKYCRS